MPDLLTICGTAFVSVFILLGVLALIIRIIIELFPAKPEKASPPGESETDHSLYAAVATVYSTHYPGKQITKIKEIK